MARPLVVVSNRGPVGFALDPDSPSGVTSRRGAGGLVSGLGPLVRDRDVLWIAAAMTEGDRLVSADGPLQAEGFHVALIDIAPEMWSQYYDTVCNEALWFAHHGLWDRTYEPSWPSQWVQGPWNAYRRVNQMFAESVIANAAPNSVVLIQDYHLYLVAQYVRDERPDLRLVHFSHTPFATPDWLSMLPHEVETELLLGLGAHHGCGFHSKRWVDGYTDSCEAAGIGAAPSFVAPLGPDPDDLIGSVRSQAAEDEFKDLDEIAGDTQLIVRVDRVELSKNIIRGFEAFELLLQIQPERRGKVTFGAFVYPSRLAVAAYDRYSRAIADSVERINATYGTPTWTPIVYDSTDNYPRSLAALRRADVVLVNPIKDGLNLVAKEAMIVNDRHGQLVLSPGAGAWDELGSAGAWRCDPFDIASTADAIAGALDASAQEKSQRSDSLKMAAQARTPSHWLGDQLAAAEQ